MELSNKDTELKQIEAKVTNLETDCAEMKSVKGLSLRLEEQERKILPQEVRTVLAVCR